MSRSATLQEFADEIKISYRLAYGMARCDLFQQLKISFDIGMKTPGKKKAIWRIDMQRYYTAREQGLI